MYNLINIDRISICYGEQSALFSIVDSPSCMEGYDLSNLTGLEISNAGSSPTFKTNLLKYFPNSMVGLLERTRITDDSQK